MSKHPKRIFITGGLGYVGGRCSSYLAKQGYEVYVGTRKADRTPRPTWLSSGALSYYSTDQSVEELTKSLSGVDVVFHLAAPNEIISGQNPEQALTENGIGTYRLCKVAKEAGVKHLIFLSTAHVYGSPLDGSYTEESLPLAKHPYSYSHLAAEHIVRSFSGTDIPFCTVVRLTNSFGAPERLSVDRWTLLVNDLCRQAVTNKKLILHSDGTALRDFVTLTDVERAFFHLLQLYDRKPFEIYNLGSGVSTKVLDMAEIISRVGGEILRQELPIEVGNKRDLATSLCIHVDKIKASGFKWLNNIEEEIAATLRLCIKS